MNLTSIILIAFAMSTDAFAAAVAKGAALHRPPFREALRTGLIFGSIETLMPLLGWGLGMVATRYLAQWDHWIAFTLLLCLGGHMIWAGFGEPEDGEEAPKTRHSFWILVLTGIATSIDALAVGVTLAFVEVSIVEAALAIGLATTLMVTLGVMLGQRIGALIGKRAEIIGGVVLIAIGALILFDHLAAGEAGGLVALAS